MAHPLDVFEIRLYEHTRCFNCAVLGRRFIAECVEDGIITLDYLPEIIIVEEGEE